MRATVLLTGALLLIGCPTTPDVPCGPDTCMGCCMPDGRCVGGLAQDICGTHGVACAVCAAGTECALGRCVTPPAGTDGGVQGCVATGCPDGQRCDYGTGRCTVGCPNGSDNECPQPGFCEVSSKQCRCSPGTHLCGAACVSDDAVATCGERCAPCPTPSVGAATCDGTACGVSCPSSHLACGGDCAACPGGATATACDGSRCVATACAQPMKPCAGTCATCPTGARQTTCDGARCVASACQPGQHICDGACVDSDSTDSCGTSCTPCPRPPNWGWATCVAGQCGIECNGGTVNCGTACAVCPSGTAVTATGCAGNLCVATACRPGFAVCGSDCVECPEGASATACSGNRCVATACQPPMRRCGDGCCGLRVVQVPANDDPVGAASVPDAGLLFAWRDASGSPRVGRPAPDGGVTTAGTVIDNRAEGLALRLASDGTEHLVYVNAITNADSHVKHAWRVPGGAWQVETVFSDPGIFLEAAADLTPGGDLRVVVSENIHDALWYMEKNGSTWTAPVTVPIGYAARGFTVTVDAAGQAHILSPTSSGLRYAFGNAANLTAGPTVTTASVYHHRPAAALNAQGELTAAWVEAGDLRVSTLHAGAWTTPTTISPASDSVVALAFDPTGAMHLLFSGCGQNGCGVRYASESASGWAFQTLRRPSGFTISPTDVAITAWAPGVAAGICSTLSDGAWIFLP